jgi:hypothetical protein
MIVLILFLSSCLLFGPGLYAALDAWMKGYRPWFWLVSLGPVGLLLMLLRPNLKRATTPEEREQWEQRADWTGGILSGITLFFAMAMPIGGMMAIYSLRSVVTAPATAVITAPPMSSTPLIEEMPTTDALSPAEAVPEGDSNQSSEPSSKPDNEQPQVP